MNRIENFLKPRFIVILFVIGMLLHLFNPTEEFSSALTPYFLFLLYSIVLYRLIIEKQYKQLKLALLISISAFLIELIGVKSGLIFGDYQYGTVLGPSILSTPIVIGALWYLVIAGGGVLFTKVQKPTIRIILVSTFAVILDLLIEPVAIKLGYWDWIGGSIPIQNYIAWFCIALVLSLIYNIKPIEEDTWSYRYLKQIYILLFIFFLLLNI